MLEFRELSPILQGLCIIVCEIQSETQTDSSCETVCSSGSW